MNDDPQTTTGKRVCAECGEWVYYDNGDVTFHCLCSAGWKWVEIQMEHEEPKCKHGTSMFKDCISCDEEPNEPLMITCGNCGVVGDISSYEAHQCP